MPKNPEQLVIWEDDEARMTDLLASRMLDANEVGAFLCGRVIAKFQTYQTLGLETAQVTLHFDNGSKLHIDGRDLEIRMER